MDYRYEVFAATVNKKGRKNQDNLIADSFVAGVSELSDFNVHFTADNSTRRVFAVSDGIGGGADGAKASQIAVCTFFSFIEELKKTDVPLLVLEKAFDEVNKVVVENFFYEQIGGATFSGILFDENRAYVFNVGDSPVYLLRNGHIFRMETSHTLANIMEKDASGNKSTYEENAIVYYMGNRDVSGSEQVSVEKTEVFPGDVFLICSDGVEKGLSDEKLKKLLKGNDTNLAAKIVEKAYKNAEKRMAPDDTTAVIIKIADKKIAGGI